MIAAPTSTKNTQKSRIALVRAAMCRGGGSPVPTAAAGGPAAINTLIATATLNDTHPQAYLADLLRRIADPPASGCSGAGTQVAF